MADKKSTVDNWKKKKWYDISADPTFDEKKIGETVAILPKNLVGRNIKKGLNELTGNIRDSSFEVTFKVNKVTGAKADTIISKFEAKTGFLRRMIRRQKSKIEPVFFVTTKDGSKLKIKVMAITGSKFTTPLRTQVRKAIIDFFNEEVSAKTTKENWNDIIFQHLSERCKAKLTKLGYINKVMIIKVTLV
jgi:ribosomal protein S3AE